MLVRALKSTVLSIAMLGALGCSATYSTDLAGTWELSQASRQQLLADAQDQTGTITFERDGTFVAQGFLEGAFENGRFYTTQTSGVGEWSILPRQGRMMVELNFESPEWRTAIDLPRAPSYELTYFLGNAEQGGMVAFEKDR